MIISIQGNKQAKDERIEFPGYSTGHTYKKYGLTFLKIDNVDRPLLGSWIVKPLVPTLSILIAVCGIPLASHFFFSFFKYSFFLIVLDTSLMICFLVSFIRTAYDGPGYYPFYWALGENPIISNDESYPFKSKFDPPPAGIISNDRQLMWARTQPRPPRSIVAKSSRRIVIRPDHYCKYSETWIGKRNFKFFILFNLYAFLFVGLIFLCGLVVLFDSLRKGNWGLFHFRFMFMLTGEFVAFEFCGLCLSFLTVSVSSLFRGITDWERTNKLPAEKFAHKTVIENIEDVMGPISKFYLYLSPFYSPWSNVPNDDLVAGYNNYYY